MTSKAAKKAYQQRKRGPKVSRAEQRRLEAEELDRQKREYEKERSANRAKAAREKKAAKEQAERAARKKLGLPEPSKFVRASQPTISVFVLNGNKRTWQDMEALAEEYEGTVCDRDSDTENPAKRVAQDDDTEDEFGDFPSLSQSDLPGLLDAVSSLIERGERKDDVQDLLGRRIIVNEDYQHPEVQSDEPQDLPTEKIRSNEENQYPEDEDVLADMATTQLLSEAADAATRTEDVILEVAANTGLRSESSEPVIKSPVAVVTSVGTRTRTSPKPQPARRPPLQERSVNMPPPSAPISKTIRSISFAATPPKAKNTPVRATNIRTTKWTNPPSATQAFLENHLDDFFPSPSQEVRELLDDIDDLPSNTQIARELSPIKPVEDDPYINMICTQDLILSPQDILEIITPSRPQTTRGVEKQAPSPTRPISREKRRFFEEKEEDLLNAALHESKIVVDQSHSDFFEEKEEDLLYGKLHESKFLADKNSMDCLVGEEGPPAKGKRNFQRIQSTATDYGDEEFNEQELLALC
jgi:hypothetical protein